MPQNLDLDQAIRLLASKAEGTWFSEAELLITNGRNLQSMDASLCREFERAAGPLTTEDKIGGIAEFHRQVLERLGLPVPSRDICPDPLRLQKLHELRPYAVSISKTANKIKNPPLKNVVNTANKLKNDRPELINHIKLDKEFFVFSKIGCDYECKSYTAGTGVEAYCQSTFPELDELDCGRLALEVCNFIFNLNEL